MADRVLRLLVDLQVDRCAEECLHTLPIPWKQNQEAYQLRYVFGYAMEGSDLPCYILWPTRAAEQSFWCIDAWKGDWVRLDKCAYMAPLGIEHFFDAFCFNPQRPWGAAAIQALGIPSCRVSKDAYLENMHVSTFLLTPRRIPVERKASTAKREVDQDMVAREESVSEKCSAAWQGARGERLTVSVMLPGRQDADDWLNFMLSQKNLWPTFTTRGTLTEEISAQVFSKERRRLQAQHLWMVVNLKWGVLVDRMYVKGPTEKPKEDLDALLFDRVARRNRTDPYDEKKYRGAGLKEVQTWWKTCKDWMARYKTHSEPFIYDIKKLLKALSDKETAAQSEVDAFMENCAKRWQTREGTYQLKRRRLPDVRDSPEYPGADHGGHLIMDNMANYYMAEENI
eukprot:symbB.v1.2.008351.t1/scaffold507.1/size305965/21